MRRIVVLCLALAMAMPMMSGQKKKAAPQKKQYDVAASILADGQGRVGDCHDHAET